MIYSPENSACFLNHPTSDVMKQFDKNTFWPTGCEKRAEMTLAASFVRFQAIQLQLLLCLVQATSGFLDSGGTQVIQSRNKIMGLACESIEEEKMMKLNILSKTPMFAEMECLGTISIWIPASNT